MARYLFRRGEFERNVITLMTGTTVAQAIPIALTPIFTRIYTPDDLGIFSLYMAIAALVSIAATARYELAIMLPEQDSDAANIAVLSMLIALGVSVLAFVLIWLFAGHIVHMLERDDIANWLYLIPLTVLLTGCYQSLNYWLNRHKSYSLMSRNRMLQAAITGSASVGFGVTPIGGGGLILGALLGQTVTTAILGKQFVRMCRSLGISGRNFALQSKLAREYKRHPLHLLPAQGIGSAAVQLPVFIVSSAFGAAATGFYALAYRVISLPSLLVSSAIGDVYRERASVAYRERGEFRGLFIATLCKTTLIGVLPFSALYLFSPNIFAWVFGESWRVAGEYAQIVAVGAFFQFIFTPIDKGALIVGATGYIFFWHLGRFILLCSLAVASGLMMLEIKMVIGLITAVSVCFYIVDGVIGYYLSKG